MTTIGSNILSPVLRGQLLAIQRTQSAIDGAQLRLATGRKVNSAIDNPQNFFSAQTLSNRSNDLSRLLDTIGQNLQVIQEASSGLQAIQTLLNLTESFMDDISLDLAQQEKSLSEIILEDNPDGYWRLNETSGNIAENLGSAGSSIDGTYNANIVLGADPLFIGADNDAAADFQGTGNNQLISINDSPFINLGTHDERTVELVFNADTTVGRQVLYEEGGNVNALAIYIEDGDLYVNGRDQGAWGPVNIHTEIESGETYHVAFVFDFPNRTFTGYLNGEEFGQAAVNATFPQHTANIGIGGMNGDSYYHDGPQSGTRNTFNGRIAEVALYNDALTENDIKERYDATFIQKSLDAETRLNELVQQIDFIAEDSSFRGTNLLQGDDLLTLFNEYRSSSLLTEGGFFDSAGLGINDDPDFYQVEELEVTFDEISEALDKVRSFGTTLINRFGVLKTRETFIKNMINSLEEGAEKLTIADQNEEGAKLLALQTRQQIQFSVLSINRGASAFVTGLFA